jgi:hypothetical protein
MNTEYGCGIAVSGGADFYREVGIPFCEEIKTLLPAGRDETPEPLKVPLVIRADAGIVLLIGATVYVASHLTKKVLDDVYSTLIQPRLKPLLEKADSKLTGGGNKRAKKGFNFSVWYDQYQALVSVTVKADSFADVANEAKLIRTVHANGLAWIETNGSPKPVHHYIIENGKVNAIPELVESVKEIAR